MRRVSLLAAVMVALSTGCGGDSGGSAADGGESAAPPGKTEVDDDSPIEAKLVSIDEDSPIVETRKVRRYGRELDRLEEKCRNPRERLADFATNSKQLLDKEGIEVSTFEMLKAAHGAVPLAAAPTDCTDIFAALVTLRKQGP
jgi:hypothetical protein